MTFLDPAHPLQHMGRVASHLSRVRRGSIAADRRRAGDEVGAREALGNDPMMPMTLLAGASIEHLARIALG